MNKFSDIAAKPARLVLSLTMVAALAACWGGGDSTPAPVKVAAANVVVGAVNITPTQKTQTAATLVAVSTGAPTPITFPTGFSGTNATGAAVVLPAVPTKVTFTTNTADATQPKFAIVSGTNHFEGHTVLGSCTLIFETSTYSAPSPFAVGQSMKIDPCTVTLPTAGKAADGTCTSGAVVVTFGTTSVTIPEQVCVASDGTISVGGTSLSGVTATLISTTGA